MPNKPVPVSLSIVVHRARSVIGRGVYGLGSGGRVPSAATPLDASGRCDCSGFVAWALGIDRYQPGRVAGGDWVETTAVCRDAMAGFGLFSHTTEPEPGDVIVYPDKGRKQGHIGVVVAVDGGKVTNVVHCAASHRPGAIKETGPEVFLRNGAITARFIGVVSKPSSADHGTGGKGEKSQK